MMFDSIENFTKIEKVGFKMLPRNALPLAHMILTAKTFTFYFHWFAFPTSSPLRVVNSVTFGLIGTIACSELHKFGRQYFFLLMTSNIVARTSWAVFSELTKGAFD